MYGRFELFDVWALCEVCHNREGNMECCKVQERVVNKKFSALAGQIIVLQITLREELWVFVENSFMGAVIFAYIAESTEPHCLIESDDELENARTKRRVDVFL